jgi:hypothetical protein
VDVLGRDAVERVPEELLRGTRRSGSGSRQIGQFWMKRL